jgi:Domain of unknown function (DUF1943)/Lipoprotein amino terminal region
LAENPEVRMAAVTGLTYCSPSTADLQRLAVRTWFEPSNQVSSYIYSTLKTLKNQPETNDEYNIIRLRAEQAYSLCKPSGFGIQFSQNWQISHFEQTLKASVGHKYQLTSSEESAIPKLMYSKLQVKTQSSIEELMETAFYIQGAEDVFEKLYDLYSAMSIRTKEPRDREVLDQNTKEVEEKMGKLNIESRKSLTPEAHITWKFIGLQKLYSLDAEYVNDILRQISSVVAGSQDILKRGMEKEYLKVLDVSGSDYAFPTESGITAFISVRNPIVVHAKMDVKMAKDESSSVGSIPQFELSTRGVVNYKSQIHAGIMTPLTGKFHVAGVEVAMHLSAPVTTKLSYENGHIHMKLATSEDQKDENEIPLFQYSVRPFTSQHDSSSMLPLSQESENKIIKSRDSKKQKVRISNMFD